MRSITRSLQSLLFAATVVALPAPVFAETQAKAQAAQESTQPVVSELEAFLVVAGEDGGEQYKSATKAYPGDVIEYRLSHLNQSGGPLQDFSIQGLVPEGTHYVGDTAWVSVPARFEVLVRGEKWQGEPAYKTVVNEAGEEVRVKAEPSDYIGVRWVLEEPLTDKAKADGKYRVRVRTQ